ncbi:MAG: hypothetical protein ACKVT2_20450 [Saprospiraceae bacterium]
MPTKQASKDLHIAMVIDTFGDVRNGGVISTRQFAIGERHLFSEVADLTEKIDYWYENPEALEEAKAQYLELVKQYRIENSYQKLKEAYHMVAI